MAEELPFNDDAAERHEQALMDLMTAIIDRLSEWRSLCATRSPAQLSAGDLRVRKAVRYRRRTPGEAFNADPVARAAGLSRAHRFRLFNNTMQISPALYFSVLRMASAIDAPANGTDSVTGVSDRLGFAAPSHFTRFCRNTQGITPTEHRRVASLVKRPMP